MHSSNHINTTENNAKNVTAFQSNVFLSGIFGYGFASKGQSAFLSVNDPQAQLQTPQSISVLVYIKL
jgi:hypothetical protein